MRAGFIAARLPLLRDMRYGDNLQSNDLNERLHADKFFVKRVRFTITEVAASAHKPDAAEYFEKTGRLMKFFVF